MNPTYYISVDNTDFAKYINAEQKQKIRDYLILDDAGYPSFDIALKHAKDLAEEYRKQLSSNLVSNIKCMIIAAYYNEYI